MSDIFVALPPATDGCVIFGKNSDRPPTEVHELVYIPARDHKTNTEIQTTYIGVDQAEHTHAVILSKPAWTWGAEMGSNEHGVCVGCTSVWTKVCQSGDSEGKLLGVDLVRLALEQGSTAKGAVDTITKYLEKYGQGGNTSKDPKFSKWTYNNSFLVADKSEAWVIDTAGKTWCTKRIESGVYNISSALSIGSDMDQSSTDLEADAAKYGASTGENGKVDFAATFSAEFPGLSLTDSQSSSNRQKCGKQLLDECSQQGRFSLENMIDILRNEKSSINLAAELLTVSSQVSVMNKTGSNIADCHWFTATPRPSLSVFKPFIFCPNADIGNVTKSPGPEVSEDLRHILYKAHERALLLMEGKSSAGKNLSSTMQTLETSCINEMKDYVKYFDEKNFPEIAELFKDVAEAEVKLYK